MTQNWLEILKTGTFKAKNGEEVTITGRDLDNIAASNPAADRSAPLVFGHPADNHPAFGWVEAVKRRGDTLLAAFKEVPDVVKQLVNDGYFKKVSVSLMPDRKTLRHVGLLGAVQPAVPGLKDVSFADADGALTVECSLGGSSGDPEGPPKTNTEGTKGDGMSEEALKKQLEEERAKRAKAEADLKAANDGKVQAETELSQSKETAARSAVETRVNGLVGTKILGRDKKLVTEVALALSNAEAIEFSEGSGKKPLREHLFDFLNGLPERELLTEFSEPEKGEGGAVPDLTGCV